MKGNGSIQEKEENTSSPQTSSQDDLDLQPRKDEESDDKSPSENRRGELTGEFKKEEERSQIDAQGLPSSQDESIVQQTENNRECNQGELTREEHPKTEDGQAQVKNNIVF